MANGEQEIGDQIVISQLKQTPQDVHGPVCHYLSHASPNLDGNDLSLSVWEVKCTQGSQSISSLASPSSWRATIVPKTGEFLCHQEKY